MLAKAISRVGVGLGEGVVSYAAKGMRNTLLVRSSLSLNMWDRGKEFLNLAREQLR